MRNTIPLEEGERLVCIHSQDSILTFIECVGEDEMNRIEDRLEIE